MSLRSEKKLLDMAKWYEHNKNTITDPIKRAEFLQVAVDNMMHQLINVLEDIKILEGRGTIARNFPNIYVPDNALRKMQREEDTDVTAEVTKISPAAGAVQKPKFDGDGKRVKT